MSDKSTGLWPTPQVRNRKGARAMRPHALGGESSPPGLEQAIELSLGIIAPEVFVPPASPQLTLFAEAFPASPTPWLADVAALTTSATSGPSSPESFASVNPDGSWRKTCQGYCQLTLDGSLERFSETWPRAGMTRNGTAYRLQPSAPLTDATASGSWPTPRAYSFAESHQPGLTALDIRGDGQIRNDRLDYLTEQFTDPNSGALNPTWVEWLMGYPLGWTACAAWATRSSRRSPSGSRGASSRLKD